MNLPEWHRLTLWDLIMIPPTITANRHDGISQSLFSQKWEANFSAACKLLAVWVVFWHRRKVESVVSSKRSGLEFLAARTWRVLSFASGIPFRTLRDSIALPVDLCYWNHRWSHRHGRNGPLLTMKSGDNPSGTWSSSKRSQVFRRRRPWYEDVTLTNYPTGRYSWAVFKLFARTDHIEPGHNPTGSSPLWWFLA